MKRRSLVVLGLFVSLFSLSAQAEQYPYLTLLCSAEGYNAQFIIQFGDETLDNGNVVEAGVHNVVRGNRFLVDKAINETTGMIGEYETEKLNLQSGGSAEWYVDLAGNTKAYLRKSSAIFGDSTHLTCESVRITQ